MTHHLVRTSDATATGAECDPADAVTKTLLAYGAIAGPIYVAVSVAQTLTRDGFDLSKHAWSLLSNGPLGWIQVTNFVVTGLMVVAGAVGLRRALRPGRASTWAPRLVGVFGTAMVAAGLFKADPALGFPPGTDQDAAEVSWHGMLHFTAAGIGFGCLIAACFVLARRYRVNGDRGWDRYSRATGTLFLLGFVAVGAGAGQPAANLAFTATVVLVLAWLSAVAVRCYRQVAAHRTTTAR